MNNNLNSHAFPKNEEGLTKREYAAIKFASSLLTYNPHQGNDVIVAIAVKMADKLFKKLEDEPAS